MKYVSCKLASLTTGTIILLLLVLSSCEKLLIAPDPDNNPIENFDLLWHSVNEKYSYFELKNVDWDAIRNIYRPQVRMDMSEKELFELLGDMLFELQDGHVNLTSDFDRSRNWEWHLDYPINFNPNIIERRYLGRDYQIAGPFQTKVFEERIGYIRYASFMEIFGDAQLDALLKRYEHLDGLIIDIRSNSGGFGFLADLLASRFTTEKTLVGYNIYKEGPGRNDFSRPMPHFIEPAGNTFTKPVIILTNRRVYSSGNIFVSYMTHLPNVTIVGDQTGGGGGTPYSSELLNGWRYRFSATQRLNANMEHIENGVPPHIKVDMLPQDETQDIDTILETALNIL